MAFSLLVELLNIRMRGKAGREEPVALHQRYEAEGGTDGRKGGAADAGQAGEQAAEGQAGEPTGSSRGKGQADERTDP
jgi:hypothetical protein